MTILEIIGTVIGTATLYLTEKKFSAWQKKQEKKKELKERPAKLDRDKEVMVQIDGYLNHLRIYTQCNRALIFEYSNSTYTHSDTSLQYVDATYEKTDETTKPIINLFKRILITPYIGMIKAIGDSPSGYLRISEVTSDIETKKIHKYWGTNTSYNFKISTSVWDGVIGLSWIHNEVELTQAQILEIQVTIMHIRDLMRQLSKK